VKLRLERAFLLLILASPAVAQRPRLDVSPLPSNSPPAGASVIAYNVLGDAKMRELLRNSFPAALTFRLELWRDGGLFDELENTTQWNVLVQYDPYTQQYKAVRRHPRPTGATREEDFGGFTSLTGLLARLEQPYPVAMQPSRTGASYYYNVILDVESLSVSDLDELQRWLSGELQPAVRGKRAPLSALRRGFETLLSRLLGGETRHYESRSGTFRT
jgi:hypothetical protein